MNTMDIIYQALKVIGIFLLVGVGFRIGLEVVLAIVKIINWFMHVVTRYEDEGPKK